MFIYMSMIGVFSIKTSLLHRQCFDWKLKGAEKVNMEEETGFSAAMATLWFVILY